MTRADLLEMVNLTRDFISPGKHNRPGTAIVPRFITIHNTSNRSNGADARSHARFVKDTGYYITRDPKTNEEKKNWVSWHYSVDDKITLQHLPETERAYHAGTAGNNSSIAIEVCMHAEIVQSTANTRAARLAALLCYDLSIPLESVVTHKYWTGKNCPELLLAFWDDFKEEVESYLSQLLNSDKPVLSHGKIFTKSIIELQNNLCWNTEKRDLIPQFIEDEEPSSIVQYGFNDQFLPGATTELPVLSSGHPSLQDYIFIHHQNLSIYFNKKRKLALYSACNFNKEAFIDMGRSNAFRNDKDAENELGDGFYKSATLDNPPNKNYFDRGHLIARRYNQWGKTDVEARQGEKDTYYFTTIHPQVSELNQRDWEKLESFIIDKKELDVKKVSIIAGAILADNDPTGTYIDKFYQIEKTIRIPVVYWKVVYYEVNSELRRIAFLMSQKHRLEELEMVNFQYIRDKFITDPFDSLGDPLKTYVIKSDLIASASGLCFAAAKELYDKEEPLEIVMSDNDATKNLTEAYASRANFLEYI